jgi:hypothetical protein
VEAAQILLLTTENERLKKVMASFDEKLEGWTKKYALQKKEFAKERKKLLTEISEKEDKSIAANDKRDENMDQLQREPKISELGELLLKRGGDKIKKEQIPNQQLSENHPSMIGTRKTQKAKKSTQAKNELDSSTDKIVTLDPIASPQITSDPLEVPLNQYICGCGKKKRTTVVVLLEFILEITTMEKHH